MNRIQQFRAIQNATGLFSKKQIEVEKIKHFAAKHFNGSIAEENVSIDGAPRKLIVMKNRDNDNIKKIIAFPNETFYVGQVVDCYGAKWLITNVNLNKQIYTVGKMTLAPNVLKFQDPQGNILSYPYFIDSSLPSLDSNKMIRTSDTIRRIKLTFDKYTQSFYIGKRFMGEVFNEIPQCWKINELNSEEEKGLLIVTLEKDEYNSETDNKEFGICNYFDPIVPSPTANCEIVYSGKAEVRAGGSYKRFNAVFYDVEGNVLDDVFAQWQIVKPIGYEDSITVEVNGNTIRIKVADVTGIIGRKILVRLIDDEQLLHELEVSVTSLI